MNRALTLLILVLLPFNGSAQVFPAEGSKLNYRIIGFSLPAIAGGNGYTLQIATGNYQSADSFSNHIVTSIKAKQNRVVAEVPFFGKQYTWRVLLSGKGVMASDSLHHFGVGAIPGVDSGSRRLRIIKPAEKYKDAYVFLDGAKALYDMKGNPVWYLPDIGHTGIPPRDMKLTPQHTISLLLDKKAYEISYDGAVLWKSPAGGTVSGKLGEGYHHEFTRLANGHYMALGKKQVQWELPSDIDTAVLNAPNAVVARDSINKKYYQQMQFGTIIEYDAAGKVVWSWNSSEYLKSSDLYYRRTMEGLFDLDVHENSFYFDEVAQAIYLSMRDVSRVVKISYPDGRVLASYGGKYIPGVRDVANDLFCYQHSCKRSASGYLYLYNNNGCNLKERPKLIMMKEASGKDHVEKAWEFECNVAGMEEKSPVDSVFTSGGNVVALPGDDMFASMSVMYGNVFIVSKNKQVLWNAVSERWNPTEQKWKVDANYRASIILNRKELETLMWNK